MPRHELDGESTWSLWLEIMEPYFELPETPYIYKPIFPKLAKDTASYKTTMLRCLLNPLLDIGYRPNHNGLVNILFIPSHLDISLDSELAEFI
jgi:hypothetical protein